MTPEQIAQARLRAACALLRSAAQDINSARQYMGAEVFDADWGPALRAVLTLKAKVAASPPPTKGCE